MHRGVRLLALAAAVEILLGVVAYAGWLAGPTPSATTIFPPWRYFVHVVVFSAAGALVVLGGRRDERAFHWGVFLLLVASTFAHTLLGLPDTRGFAFRAARAIELSAFLPAVLWLFFRDFPDRLPFGIPQRVSRTGIGTALVISWFLFTATLTDSVLSGRGSDALSSLRAFSVSSPTGYYWILLFAITLPAFPFALSRVRSAPIIERRRLRVFVMGFVVGFAPLTIQVFLESAIPAYNAFTDRPSVREISGLVVHGALLLIPIVTTYSVLVDHVLDVRLVIRTAIRYALARASILAAASLPMAWALWSIWSQRDRTLVQLFSGESAFWLLSVPLFFFIVWRFQKSLLFALDRRFFREQYDAGTILTELAERSSSASDVHDLSNLIIAETTRALHLRNLALFFHDQHDRLVTADNEHPSLPLHSKLAGLLGGSREPLDVDLADEGSVLARLPVTEQYWLVDGKFQMLVPVLDVSDTLLGVLALGGKRSELPFSREDRALLKSIATSAAVTIQGRGISLASDAPAETRESPAERAESRARMEHAEAAQLCIVCRKVHASSAKSCGCGGTLSPAGVPHVLNAKFVLLEHIGAGGMGVVFRALDRALDRVVAVKTLPRVSPSRVARMHREARAMAAVSHQNLALIYAAESWRGLPVLVVEYLPGGTLDDRLRDGPLSPAEVVALGASMAAPLEKIHAAGILHRDIKPSNIGFAVDGAPKLLDFGLARILREHESQPDESPDDVLSLAERETRDGAAFFQSGISQRNQLVGTPAYMAPEAIGGSSPGPSFDLWSLAVVLYEALTETHPFRGPHVAETLERIQTHDPIDPRSLADCPDGLAEFLMGALAKEPGRRPRTAAVFRSRLRLALERDRADLELAG